MCSCHPMQNPLSVQLKDPIQMVIRFSTHSVPLCTRTDIWQHEKFKKNKNKNCILKIARGLFLYFTFFFLFSMMMWLSKPFGWLLHSKWGIWKIWIRPLTRKTFRRRYLDIFLHFFSFLLPYRLRISDVLHQGERHQRPERASWKADLARGKFFLLYVHLLSNEHHSENHQPFNITRVYTEPQINAA